MIYAVHDNWYLIDGKNQWNKDRKDIENIKWQKIENKKKKQSRDEAKMKNLERWKEPQISPSY